MCIILVKNKGIKMPPLETIKTCVDNNSDGNGIMWVENNKIMAIKGLMTYDDLYREIANIESRIDITSIPLAIHCRITTHGGTNKENTHPFPITCVESELKELSFERTGEDKIVMHNGIISGYGSYNGELSDTQEFIRDFLSHVENSNKQWNKCKHMVKAIENVLGSRLCVLNLDGSFDLLGKGWEEHNGIWYSNSSYKENRYSYTTTYYNSKYNGYTKKYDDDEEYNYSVLSDELDKALGYSFKSDIQTNIKDLMYITDSDFMLYDKSELNKGNFVLYSVDKNYVIPAIDENETVYLFCHETLAFIERADLYLTNIDGDDYIFDYDLAYQESIAI